MDKADDLAFARFLQEQFNNESDDISTHESPMPSSLVDEAWEVIDPNPDVRQLFLQFNDEYFDSLLGSVEVRWSPRMTLCAGVCCYEGRGGLCSIRLSEPLLKLRPRKDLVQTLLHEMIHAVLFVTQNNKDHDGHGPEFHKHMYRINQRSGTNISVYHNFHDEVNSYRLHWWKCNGHCQKWSPFYGVVKRAMNRAPAPRDTWWDDHKRKCGGEFTKVKEPENYGKRKAKGKSKEGINAGSSQEKRKQLKGVASKPELPTFFDKIKKSQQPSNISTDSKGTVDKKDNISLLKDIDSKGTINKNDESSSDNSNENFENSTKKQKLDKVMSTSITPFAGVGHVLGGSGGGPQKTSKIGGVQMPLKTINIQKYSEKDNLPQSSQTPLSVGSRNKTLNNVKKKKDKQPSSYTIVDAFKRSNKDMQTSQVSQSSSPDGSRHKPINLCGDSPGVMQSLAGSSSDVSCPVCQLFIPITHINAHLDNCLPVT